tara:strand:+ start:895 stop:1227 length:333 start_codon:yes stop_codon:yes gene_type:complete
MFKQKTCVPCKGGIPPLKIKEIVKYKKLINENWTVNNEAKLSNEYHFNDYMIAIKFVNEVAKLSEKEGHHPFIHINYKIVKIILFSHKINGLHENDFIMANKIDELIYIK